MTKEEDIKIMVDRLSFQWENSKQLRKPETKCLYQAIQIQKLSRENEKHFIMALIKEKILPVAKSLYTKSCTHIQFLFCKKDAFQYKDFSRLKCQQKWKNIDTACL